MNYRRFNFIGLILVLAITSCAPAQTNPNPGASAAAAYIQNKGSDTMVNLALAWA